MVKVWRNLKEFTVIMVGTSRNHPNTNVSVRAVRRYGENSGIKQKKTIKRTYRESEYKGVQQPPITILLIVLTVFHLFRLQWAIVAEFREFWTLEDFWTQEFIAHRK
jgi:hypothetical protein